MDTGDPGSIPASGRSPGLGNGNPLQYSCLGNPMRRGASCAQSMGLRNQTHQSTQAQGALLQSLKICSTNHGRTLGEEISSNTKAFHLLFQLCVCVLVIQLCPTLCDPMDCSLPGFSVYGILQARTLEWVAIPFSREPSQPRD